MAPQAPIPLYPTGQQRCFWVPRMGVFAMHNATTSWYILGPRWCHVAPRHFRYPLYTFWVRIRASEPPSPPLVQFSPTPAISSLCCLNDLLVSLQVHVEMKQQQPTRTYTHTRAGTVQGGGASQVPCPCQTPFQQCHCSTWLCAFSVSRRAWGWVRTV